MTNNLKYPHRQLIAISISLLFALVSARAVFAQTIITGRAWNDANLNGQIDEGEVGIGGIRVELEDEAGQTLETVTAEDGSWSLGLVGGQQVRVIYDTSQKPDLINLSPSQAGWQTVNLVELESLPKSIDAGYYDAPAFCAANPALASSRYIAGDALATDGLEGYQPGDYAAILSFPYDAEGREAGVGYQEPNSVVQIANTGAVWGLAWDHGNQHLYSSAFVKRHAGLGPAGIGGIYVSDFAFGASTKPYIDLTEAGVELGDPGERLLPNDPSTPSVDGTVFSQIGKIGLGGLDISPDGKTLYAMNLGGRELVTIDTESVAVKDQHPIPDLECTNGETRPFAVKAADDGAIYVGAVCSAELEGGTAADLSAHILEFDGKAFSSIISFPLDSFQRGLLNGGLASGQWNPWTDEWIENDGYAVPILSDIEIDDDGSFIVALMDRTGHMGGLQQPHPTNAEDTNLYNRTAGGDIIRICKVEESYVVEGSSEECAYNQQGGNRGDEFYAGEQFEPNFETSLGGIALLPNSGEVAVGVSDPFDYLTSGVRWLDNTNGESRRGYQLSPGNLIFFNGANGVGDIEIICQTPPVEVGSRIWRDMNQNNQFDANDQPLPNVPIELFNVNSGEVIATVHSDPQGRFAFSSGFGPATNGIAYGLVMHNDVKYQLRTLPDQGAVSGLTLLENSSSVSPLLNSDANLGEQFIHIEFEVSDLPTTLKHLDFGFVLQEQQTEVENTGDTLEPPSNVVGIDSGPSAPTEPVEGPRMIYGIPVDPASNIFLAFMGTLIAGVCGLLIGILGIIGTVMVIRLDKKENEAGNKSGAE